MTYLKTLTSIKFRDPMQKCPAGSKISDSVCLVV